MQLNDAMAMCTPGQGFASTVTLAQLNSMEARRHPGAHLPFRRLVNALCDELRADEVPSPEYQPFTFACIWTDLARLAGEVPPTEVAALVYGDTAELVEH